MRFQAAVYVRARALTGIDDLIRRHGGDVAAIFGAAGLDPQLLNRPDAIVRFDHAAALLDRGAEALRLPDIGLRLSAYQDISVLGPVALLARYARDVREALDGIARQLPYHTPGARLALHIDPATGDAQLRYALHGDEGAPGRHVVELAYAIACRFLRMITHSDGSDWQVRFRHSRPLSLASYRKLLGCAVTFDQHYDAVCIPARLLDVTIDSGNAELRRIAERYVSHVVRRFPLDIASQTAALVERQLALGNCNLALIARQLGLHARTLQRRLAEQSLHFEDIVDRIRRERTEEFLTYSAIPLTQLAGLLGYADQTAFTRACRRWFAESPQKIRQRRSGRVSSTASKK